MGENVGRVGEQGGNPKSGVPYAELGELLSDLLLSLSGQKMDNIRETLVEDTLEISQNSKRDTTAL